jgi:TalC/MipB family fructose-6-phosphate aldolase
MALYIDSAYLDDITLVARELPITGITMNPTLLLAAFEQGQRLQPQALLEEMLKRLGGTIFIQSGAIEEDAMYREARSYIEADAKRVIPKIPMVPAGLNVGLRLYREKQSYAFTAVTTVVQAYSGALAGADYIIPYYNRLQRSGISASERIAKMVALLQAHRFSTRILAASIKSTEEAEAALLAGAHDLTVSPQVLSTFLREPQSEEAVVRFAQDWQKMKDL